MSGKQQHWLPFWLLKGFIVPGSKPRGKPRGGQAWVFHRERVTKKSAIDKVAKEGHFYSKPSGGGVKTLDDYITDYETPFGAEVEKLRQCPLNAPIDGRSAAKISVHLATRSAYLRGLFTDAFGRISNGFSGFFASTDNLKQVVGLEGLVISPLFEERVGELYDQTPAFRESGLPRAVFVRVAFMLLRENSNLLIDALPLVQMMLAQVGAMSSGIARKAHNDVLSKDLAPAVRAETLAQLRWSIHPAPPAENFVLPDSCVLADDETEHFNPLYMLSAASVETVALPISSSRLLLGVRTKLRTNQPPGLDPQSFNVAAAACSGEMFFAPNNTPELERLRKVIGTRSAELLDSVVARAITDLKPPGDRHNEGARAGHHVQRAAVPTEVGVKYEVEFRGFWDQAAKEQIADVVQEVVSGMHGVLSLGRLDGITFAVDYEAALRDLDRGFPANAPLCSLEERSAAKTPLVLRDGIVKGRVIARAELGLALVAAEDAVRVDAIRALIFSLALVAEAKLFDESFPGVLLRPTQAGYDNWLFARTKECWESYFAARWSAHPDSSIGSFYTKALVESLGHLKEDMSTAVRRFDLDQDLHALGEFALARMNRLLCDAARVLGAYDALGDDAFEGSRELTASLERAGIANWFQTLRRDLNETWARMGKWNTLSEFYVWNLHLERLMWPFGFVMWELPSGDIWFQIQPQAHRPLAPGSEEEGRPAPDS